MRPSFAISRYSSENGSPVSLSPPFVASASPPPSGHADRDRDQRDDVLTFEEILFEIGEVLDQTGDHLASSEHVDPSGEVGRVGMQVVRRCLEDMVSVLADPLEAQVHPQTPLVI